MVILLNFHAIAQYDPDMIKYLMLFNFTEITNDYFFYSWLENWNIQSINYLLVMEYAGTGTLNYLKKNFNKLTWHINYFVSYHVYIMKNSSNILAHKTR